MELHISDVNFYNLFAVEVLKGAKSISALKTTILLIQTCNFDKDWLAWFGWWQTGKG